MIGPEVRQHGVGKRRGSHSSEITQGCYALTLRLDKDALHAQAGNESANPNVRMEYEKWTGPENLPNVARGVEVREDSPERRAAVECLSSIRQSFVMLTLCKRQTQDIIKRTESASIIALNQDLVNLLQTARRQLKHGLEAIEEFENEHIQAIDRLEADESLVELGLDYWTEATRLAQERFQFISQMRKSIDGIDMSVARGELLAFTDLPR